MHERLTDMRNCETYFVFRVAIIAMIAVPLIVAMGIKLISLLVG